MERQIERRRLACSGRRSGGGLKMGPWRTVSRGLVVVPLVAAVAAGCGGGGGRAASTSSGSLFQTSEAAARGFGDYLGFASGKKCDLLEPELDDPDYFVGSMSKEILDSYSCDKVMTARERGRQCDRIVVRPVISGEPVTVSTEPRRLRYSVDWKGETVCDRDAGPGNDVYEEHGSYEVTVEQGDGGWMVVGFTLRSGPGAGHTGGVS
ncbi:hypothetical protein AB3X52_13305 [Nocardioides sp. DS6]|uniref:Lipoprotein n=1 Tax=Nocardioides eburneus TaxID=3231482 RepID=A0ABV3T076_9ACTN